MSPSEPKPMPEPPRPDASPRERTALEEEGNFRSGFARWMRPEPGASGSGVGLGITVAVLLFLGFAALGFWSYLKAHLH
jgi:hypothetical protein